MIYNESTVFIIKYEPLIGVSLGGLLVAGGIFLSWRIKQLGLGYDPERSLAFEAFDYFQFIWKDEKPEKEPKDDTETAIDKEVAD